MGTATFFEVYMQLKEIINELLEKKFHNSQRDMARALDIGEMDLRRLAGIAPGTGRNQEKIFRVTLKVLELCKHTGIDPAKDLLPPMPTEVINDVKSDGPAARSAHARAKARIKKKGLGPFQTGGIKGR